MESKFNWDVFWSIFLLVFCVGVLLLMTSISNVQKKQLKIMQNQDAAITQAAQKQIQVSDALLNTIPR